MAPFQSTNISEGEGEGGGCVSLQILYNVSLLV
jgi:hypothetical protein